MKNMKISKAEHPQSMDEVLAQGGQEYAHGLRIHLEPAILAKLDLPRLPIVGQMMGLHAVVEVVEVSLENAANGTRNKSMVLQITDMELKDKSEDAPANDDEITLLGG
jgi:hypothetical protein